MTDSSGAVVWAADYKPFGEATVTTSTITNNLRFPGQYFDADTGLSYNYYRDYNPITGRYIEADPIGLEGGINLFTYAEGSPLTRTDPSGTSWSQSFTMGWQWLTGTGPNNQTFGPGSSPVNEMRDAPGVQGARNLFYQKNAGKACECRVPMTNYRASFGLTGLVRAGLNPTRQFVGSYSVDIYPLENCKIKIVLNNTTSFTSFTYGIGPDWQRSTFRPMGNMTQTYWWIEP
jgi:RHS repeat-associated protein